MSAAPVTGQSDSGTFPPSAASRRSGKSWRADRPVLLGVSPVTLMVGIAAAWYALVVFAVTTAMVRSAFHRIRRWIDRIAGIPIMGCGTKLVLDR